MSPSTAFNIPESEKHTAQRLTSVLDAKVSASRLKFAKMNQISLFRFSAKRESLIALLKIHYGY